MSKPVQYEVITLRDTKYVYATDMVIRSGALVFVRKRKVEAAFAPGEWMSFTSVTEPT